MNLKVNLVLKIDFYEYFSAKKLNINQKLNETQTDGQITIFVFCEMQ